MVVNTKLVIAVAAVLLIGLLLWQPWNTAAEKRTIEVDGRARITAVPDTYQFNPSYQRTDADREKALTDLNAHIQSVTDGLVKLGVGEDNIKLNVSAYDQPHFERSEDESAVSARITVKVDDKDMAQKVQNYLLTTNPEGQITPRPSFSDDKRDRLQSEARAKAIANAQAEAEKTASQLGVKVVKVLSVKDTAGGDIIPLPYESQAVTKDSGASEASLPLFPGDQEISFSVRVTFEIK